MQEVMKDLITQAGFVDVVETKYKWPIGPWSNDQRLKDLGRWNMNHWENGLEGWTMRFCTKYLDVCGFSSFLFELWMFPCVFRYPFSSTTNLLGKGPC